MVSPVPATANPKDAIQAAKLALAEAANRPLAEHPHDLERLWVDPEPATPPSGEAPPRNAHVLGLADSDEAAAALSRLATSAGLRPWGFIPSESIGFVAAIEAAIKSSKASGKTAVCLFCGEHTSILAAATAGRFRFVRRIGLGSEMLVEAMAREIRPSGPESAPITLERADAATILFRCGIPSRGQPYDEQTGITADAVLPLVQPLLQRCVIEIKQSLRFGLEESERSGVRFIALGPGSRIARLMPLIAEQAALVDETPAATAVDAPPGSAAVGSIHSYATGTELSLRLLPRALAAEFTIRKVKRGMFAGFAAAAAMVALSAVTTRMELPRQLKRMQQAQASLEAARPVMELNGKLISAQAAVAAANQRIRTRLADTAPWDAMLAILAQTTPSSVKISEAQMNFDGHKPVCRINGQTLPSHGDSNAELRAYLDALAAIPLIQSTRLGATQRGESNMGTTQTFEMTITLFEVPMNFAKPSAAFATVRPDEEQRK